MSGAYTCACAAEVALCIEDACAACAVAAPTGSEADRAAWVAARLTAAGLRPQRDGVGNVIVQFGSGAHPLVVAAHMDTVFADLCDIRVTRDGPVLRAPGIGDNSLGVAGLLYLARRASQLQWAERVPLALAATVGEEGLGNLRGSKAVVQQLDPGEFVALEGGFQDDLIISGAGSARFQIDVRAAGGHSWANRGEPSAVHVLVGILGALLDRYPTESFNVGTVSGGDGINVLAHQAAASVEFRDLSNRKLELAQRLLLRRTQPVPVEREGADVNSAHVTVTTLGMRLGGRVAKSHPLVRDALGARADAGLARPAFTTASTDANAALGQGVPAVTIGLAHNHGAHSLDEHVDVTDLDRALGAAWSLIVRRTDRDAPGHA
jgi:acetylornithine deacetylase/succinyl-diaminopimelate desuccinylase-like protein